MAKGREGFAPAALAVLFGVSSCAGCSSAAARGGPGDACLLFSDCAENLICVPAGTRMQCSADASALVKTEDGGARTQTATSVGADGSVAPPDSAGPDTGSVGSVGSVEAAAPSAPDGAGSVDASAPGAG